ncbi:Oxidase FUB9 [Colletotrichum shisoi]|uniref:Oxidase FUB9 n=1 Tax=Colletotrichum shisoi TaxID=2078593 RepID=A0A5Q4BZS3_9PEZI|nr:Oxidase FUB9 [Colletotrichum shisoi]
MYRDYYDEGAMGLVSLRDNEEAYNRYKIMPRILVNVDKIDMSTTIFETKVSFPLGFSPTAMHRMAHPDGELATSRAAAKLNICMALSSYPTESMENVAAQGGDNPYVMQLCVLGDRERTLQILRRAEDPSLDWDSAISWLKEHTKLQLWLKGVYTPDDVALAIRQGLDVAAGKIPIAVDGGIRRGTDIFKALALGAPHCFVGRIPIWGLAYNGQEGVELALKILQYELKITIALGGCRTIEEISRGHVA